MNKRKKKKRDNINMGQLKGRNQVHIKLQFIKERRCRKKGEDRRAQIFINLKKSINTKIEEVEGKS